MTRTWIAVVCALILCAASISIFLIKIFSYGYPLLPNKTFDNWYVEFSLKPRISPGYITFDGIPAELKLQIPQDDDKYAIANIQLLSPGFGKEQEETGQKKFHILTKRNLKEEQNILLRFNVFELDNTFKQTDLPVSIESRFAPQNRISNPDERLEVFYNQLDTLSQEAQRLSADTRSYVRQVIRILVQNKETLSFLKEEIGTRRAEMVVSEILKSNGIISRTAHGFKLSKESRNADLRHWIEVYENKKWERYSFDLNDKDLQTYYRWSIDNDKLVDTSDHIAYTYGLAVKANSDSSLTRLVWTQENQNFLLKFFTLQTLPLKQQLVVQVLLLLPLGALGVSFFRQVIGVTTFGTFMPVLVALAFRETGLLYGICFFFAVITIGLIARKYIDKLHLLMVPRLSAILSVIVVVIILFMLLTKDQNLSFGISVALFPVVIITMFIERMSTILDEMGPRDACYGFFGSLGVASLIYVLVLNDITKHIMFTFPELLFVIIAACLVLGRYNGYKLTEYWRFRQIKNNVV